MRSHTRHFCLLSAVLLLLGGCGLTGSDEPGDDFDRSAMLENYGRNLILPSYEALKSDTDRLRAETGTFADNPTRQNLASLRDALKEARLAWQDASPFQFGPAEMRLLRPSLNTYPADTQRIRDNMDSGEYELGTIANRAAAGFPAMGYLLYGLGESDAQIVDRYTGGGEAQKRRDYLLAVADRIKGLVDETASGWQAGQGDYLGTFLSEERAGTDVGSSLGMLINAVVQHYERFLRDGKIGIPSGVRSAGVPRPAAVESYYGGYSAELALANLKTVRRLFRGRSADGTDGVGLEENLEAVGAGQLAAEINRELDEAVESLESLSDPLHTQIENDNEPVLTAFSELQELVPLLKADMPSMLGITITYQDNDSD